MTFLFYPMFAIIYCYDSNTTAYLEINKTPTAMGSNETYNMDG
jgi:hypothetical protein